MDQIKYILADSSLRSHSNGPKAFRCKMSNKYVLRLFDGSAAFRPKTSLQLFIFFSPERLFTFNMTDTHFQKTKHKQETH